MIAGHSHQIQKAPSVHIIPHGTKEVSPVLECDKLSSTRFSFLHNSPELRDFRV